MCNGVTERFNLTLLNMLGTLENNKKANWKSHVASLVHAYNCTRHETTRQSPFFLMVGRNPNLPVDIAFGIKQDKREPQTKCVQRLRKQLLEAYKLALNQTSNSQEKQKNI